MKRVDIVIVGGGINGVGVAQAAAASGYSVKLLERGRIGGQTSSNSSKLIHGGLRYLESGHLSMVKKSLAQRTALLNIAPELVKPVPFYIPVYESSSRSPLTIRAGLSAYAILSELTPYGRFRLVPRVYWSQIKGLKLQGLKALYQYWDAQTDDAALTRAVAKSAVDFGASMNECVAEVGIRYINNRYLIKSMRQTELEQIEAKVVVNAAGPWVNQFLSTVSPTIPPLEIDWVQGSHILLDIPPPQGILYLESCFDNRVVFVIPWQGKTLLGTTEITLESLPDRPKITDIEIDYLLGIYCYYFPAGASVKQLKGKITKTFCGIRVLPRHSGEQVFSRNREVVLHTAAIQPRLISIYGGKLTTYRDTAQEVIALIKPLIGERKSNINIDQLKLSPIDSTFNF